MTNEKFKKQVIIPRENNFFYYCYESAENVENHIIKIHLSNLDNFRRTLSILRRILRVKSIEIELKRDLHNNDITTIADLCDQIIKIVISNEHMNASTVWIYSIKKIIDEIVSKKNDENNNDFEYSLDFDNIKSNFVTYHDNYINELKIARSNLDVGKVEIKNKNNKKEIKYHNIIADGLDELISKTQNILSTINNFASVEELELNVNN